MKFGAIAGFVLIFSFLTIAVPAPGQEPRIWHEQNSGVVRPSQKIVTDQAEFESAWKQIFRGQPAPRVDFQREFAVCVCLGGRNSGGYRIVFEGEYAKGDKLIIPIFEKEPSGFYTETPTKPCAIKIFEKRPGLEPVLALERKPM